MVTRRRRAFSLVEFLVASVLTVTVVVMSSSAIASGEKALTSSRNRDRAVLLAADVLAKSALLACGFGLFDNHAAAISGNCRNVIAPDDPNPSFTGGDFSFRSGRYEVYYTTRWRQFSAQSGTCAAGPESADKLVDAEKYQPSLLVVTVTVNWSEFGRPRTFSTSTTRAVPDSARYQYAASYHDLDSGSLVVRPPSSPGTPVDVIVTSGTATIRRRVYTDPADSTGKGCAWFPFLAPGAYTYSIGPSTGTGPGSGGGSGVTVTVDSSTPKVVP